MTAACPMTRLTDPARYAHHKLRCGIDLAIEALPGRKITSVEIRLFGGIAAEPADLLGLAFTCEQTISKGTQRRSGQELLDAFDAIGALHGSWVGRESIGFRCTGLTEHFDTVVELHAEMLRTPTFPDESVQVTIELARQELTALEDDPGELARKLTLHRAYGPILGRHAYGERETLARIGRDHVVDYWKKNMAAARMQVAVAGPVDPRRVTDAFERAFAGFGNNGSPPGGNAIQFSSGRWHTHKDLEQQQIAICWPGVGMTDADYPIERVMLAVLGDGMSSRLFTEVREKQGLVYWVGAWHEHPKQGGMIHLGASSTPARCEQTYTTLLREVDRLAEDITPDELARAKTLLVARSETHGDMTRARASELSSDLFYFGKPVTLAEKNAAIEAVTTDDIRGYFARHPRNGMCVVTLGPAGVGEKS